MIRFAIIGDLVNTALARVPDARSQDALHICKELRRPDPDARSATK
jgi:hypothetical protein